MASFSDLPVELLDRIAGTQCLYCTPREERCCFDAQCGCTNVHAVEHERIGALAALCRTSRRLNSAATRHLYHRLSTERWWPLARTLLARKDLAQLVKTLRCNNRFSPTSNCPPEVVAYFQEQRKVYVDGLPEDQREHASSSVTEKALHSNDSNVEIDIMTSLCPNIETLHAVIDYFDVFRFCTPQSMTRLRNVAVSHADTELGLSLEFMEPLFRAAPNITNIIVHMASSCERMDVALDKVTSLEFQFSDLSDESLVNILSAFPNVETFRYEMGGAVVGSEQFTLAQARDAFLAHAPKLKLLRLDTGDNNYYGEEWDDDEARELERALEQRGARLDYSPHRLESD